MLSALPQQNLNIPTLSQYFGKRGRRMLLQGLRQYCSRGSHACGKRRRPCVVNRAQCSSAPRDELVHLLGPASGLSSCQWSNDEPREAMLPQPQYEGDWEIQAEEEDQQERIGAKDREGEDEGEEGGVFGGGQTPHRPGAFATDHATPAASRRSGADSYKESYQDEYWERPGIVQATSRCPALVLNQDLTPLTLFPLTIAPWWSAVRSTLRGRVSVLSSYDRGVRSTHALHQLPSVVALTRQQTPGQRRQAGALEGREGEAGCKAGGGRGEGDGERRFWPAARTPRPFRRNVALRDGYVCCFCGRRLSYRTLTLDHVVPRCLGGEDSWENLASACRQCNSRKGSLLVSELGRIDMRLLRVPYAPTALQLAYAYVDLLPAAILNQWGRYLEGPLAREAAKVSALHATFSLPTPHPTPPSFSKSGAQSAPGGSHTPCSVADDGPRPRNLVDVSPLPRTEARKEQCQPRMKTEEGGEDGGYGLSAPRGPLAWSTH